MSDDEDRRMMPPLIDWYYYGPFGSTHLCLNEDGAPTLPPPERCNQHTLLDAWDMNDAIKAQGAAEERERLAKLAPSVFGTERLYLLGQAVSEWLRAGGKEPGQ